MKNLFSINESEKERILGMHREATIKQYIKESDEQELDEFDWGAVGTGAAEGAATGVAFGGLGAIPGAIIGGALSIITQAFSGPGSKDAAEQIVQGCKTKGVGETTMDDSAIDGVVDKLWNAMEGMGTDEEAIGEALGSLQTIPDLCAVVKRYAENHPGYTLFDDLDGDIDEDSEWNQYVYQPMIKTFRRTQQIVKQAKQQQTNPDQTDTGAASFSKFPCVPAHSKAKQNKMSNGSIVYFIGDVVYYNNGRKKLADGTMTNYTCNDKEFKTQTGGKTGGTGYSSRIKPIQKQVGVAESGTMDQATIDAIYNKLKSTPTGPETSTNVVGGEA